MVTKRITEHTKGCFCLPFGAHAGLGCSESAEPVDLLFYS